jgi:hypothetical protein
MCGIGVPEDHHAWYWDKPVQFAIEDERDIGQ